MKLEEIWKDVVGYEGYYQVSSFGRVKSLIKNIIMSQYIGKNGYLHLRLGRCGNEKSKLVLVHRLVAEAFIPNPDNLPQVGHKDETKTNNHVNNLKWVTSLENNNEEEHKKRISNGRKKANLPKNRNLKVCCEGKAFVSLMQMCAYYNMNPPTVWRWLNNKTKMPKEWKEKGLRYVESG